MELIDFDSKKEWLDFRLKYVSSTEAAALFSVSPYLTEFELYHAKKSGTITDFATNDRIELGNYLEDGIARFAAHKLECKVEPFKSYAFDDELRMGSSFDYEIRDGENAGWLMEVKNVDYLRFRDTWLDGEPPFHIIIQVQHQLELLNRPGAVIAVLVGGNDLHLVHMPRDEELGKMIRNKIKAFWLNVNTSNAPEPDFERDAKIIQELYKKTDDGKTQQACARIIQLADVYEAAKIEEKKAKLSKEATKAELLTIMKETEVSFWDNGKVTLKPNKNGSRVLNISLK